MQNLPGWVRQMIHVVRSSPLHTGQSCLTSVNWKVDDRAWPDLALWPKWVNKTCFGTYSGSVTLPALGKTLPVPVPMPV